MIIGNPFQIAIWVDAVPEWSSYEVEFGCFARDPAGREASDNNKWVEGILMLLIDGRYLNGKTMQTTTLTGEWGGFKSAVKRMAEEASNTNGRNKTELFNSAHIPRYDIEYIGDDKGDGVEIAPMQISDYGWIVYHFVDHEEEVLVYKHTDSEEIHEKRMPLGTTRAVFLEAAERMKIFDAPL